MSHSYETILFDVGDDHVATITLNLPEQLNSITEQMTKEMVEVWNIVRMTDDIHAAVVRANGERAFSTGLDVKRGRWWRDDNVWTHIDPGVLLAPKQHKVWKPVICAVHGMCAGGGMYFLNEADIIICSEDATFFDPHANGGVVSAIEAMGMIHRGIPLGDVLRWALMGNEERISASTALRLGLVTEVTTREDLWPRAHDLAAQIAERRPIAIQGTIRAIWESLDMPRSIALQNGIEYTHIGNPREEDRPPLAERKRKRPPVVR